MEKYRLVKMRLQGALSEKLNILCARGVREIRSACSVSSLFYNRLPSSYDQFYKRAKAVICAGTWRNTSLSDYSTIASKPQLPTRWTTRRRQHLSRRTADGNYKLLTAIIICFDTIKKWICCCWICARVCCATAASHLTHIILLGDALPAIASRKNNCSVSARAKAPSKMPF